MNEELTSHSAQKIQQLLEQKGFDLKVVQVAHTTRTAAEAATTIGCDVGAIVKSLVFCTKQSQQPILVIASGSNRVNEKKIGQLVGEKIKRPDADYVKQHTGFAIGGIPPIGHSETMPTFIDEDLMHYDTVWAAAGSPFAVFPLTPSLLPDLTGGTVISIQ